MVLATTRNLESDKSKALAAAGAILVQADMNNLGSLKNAFKVPISFLVSRISSQQNPSK